MRLSHRYSTFSRHIVLTLAVLMSGFFVSLNTWSETPAYSATPAGNFHATLTNGDPGAHYIFSRVHTSTVVERNDVDIANQSSINLDLPEGDSMVYLNPTGDETIRLAPVQYLVTIANRIVSKVMRISYPKNQNLNPRTAVKPINGIYPLSFDIANLVGTLNDQNGATPGTVVGLIKSNYGEIFYGIPVGSNGKFAAKVPVGTYLVHAESTDGRVGLSSSSCKISVSQTRNCDVVFPRINLKFKTLDLDGTIDTKSIGVGIDYLGDNNSFSIQPHQNSDRTYQAGLIDGAYGLYLYPLADYARVGSSRYLQFTVGNGAVQFAPDGFAPPNLAGSTFNIQLKHPNFIAQVMANGHRAQGAYYLSYGQDGGGDKGNADDSGIFSTVLTSGRNTVVISPGNDETASVVSQNYYVDVESGTVTHVLNAIGETISAVGGVYPLNFIPGNVSGSLTGLRNYNNSYLNVFDSNNQPINAAVYLKPDGSFSAFLQPDTYTLSLQSNQGFVNWKCVVTSARYSTCNHQIPSDNFTISLSRPDGLGLVNHGSIYISGRDESNYFYFEHELAADNSGLFHGFLEDGSYRVITGSDTEPVTNGLSQTYNLVVHNGQITSFISQVTGTEAVDGVNGYSLSNLAVNGILVIDDQNAHQFFLRGALSDNDLSGYNWASSVKAQFSGPGGRIYFNIDPGTYRLVEGYGWESMYGFSNPCTVNEDTVTICTVSVPFQNANFRIVGQAGQASSAGTLNVSSTAQASKMGLSANFRGNFSNGLVSFGLQDGDYTIVASSNNAALDGTSRTFLVHVGEGIVETVTDQGTNSPISPTDGYFNLNLGSPNVVGTLNVDGQSYLDANIASITDLESNRDFNDQTNQNFDPTSGFALHLPIGRYILGVTYSVHDGNSSYTQNAYSSECDVTSDTPTTCNIHVGVPNLLVKPFDGSGAPLGSGAYVCIYSGSGIIKGQGGCVSGSGSNGVLKQYLADGDYTLFLCNNSNDTSRGSQSIYAVTVHSDSITSFVQQGSTQEIAPNNGVYQIALLGNNVAGVVVAGDNQAPVPNAQVNISGPIGTGIWTNPNGAFGFHLPQDGSYSIQALPDSSDINHASSAVQNFTITNGVGPLQLQLSLRAPNFRGTVHGLNGLSRKNWISVIQIAGINPKAINSQVAWGNTNNQWAFAFYLNPGVYVVRAGADVIAGGASTVSQQCEVLTTGVTNCDFSLNGFNVLGKAQKADGSVANISNCSSVQFEFSGGGSQPISTWENSRVFENGTFGANLSDGNWWGYIGACPNTHTPELRFNLQVAGGVVTKWSSSDGINFAKGSDNRYVIVFPAPNLEGSVLESGNRVNYWNQVNVYQEQSDGKYNIQSQGTNSGSFSFLLPPGTYKLVVTPDGNENERVSSTTLSNCVVPDSGTVTCNVNLNQPNVKATVVSPSGVRYFDSQINIWKLLENGEAYPTPTQVSAGNFSAHLDDGNYRVYVQPGYNNTDSYTPRFYLVTVESGTVQSIVDVASGTSPTISNGRYQLALGTGSLVGSVFMPDTSTTTVPYLQIKVFDAQGQELSQYNTNTNSQGKYSLNLPDGDYFIQAIISGIGVTATSSPRTPVHVSGPQASPFNLRLRTPNLYGRVVSPTDSSVGIPWVWINAWIGKSYFWGYTDQDGRFGGYVDDNAPNCPAQCSILLYPQPSNFYTVRNFTVESVGNLGNVAIGGVSSYLSVSVPSLQGNLPNSFGFVNISKLDLSGNIISSIGVNADQSGLAPLPLESGGKYSITAYPSGAYQSNFSSKGIAIDSFDPVIDSQLAITFDTPNIKFQVTDRHGLANSFGWYTLEQWTNGDHYASTGKGYLSSSGYSAFLLPDGNYRVHFYPGKINGVDVTDTFTVTGTLISGPNISNNVERISLPGGNVSGIVSDTQSAVISSAAVTAIRADDPTKLVTSSTDATGYFELNLDMTHSWIIKSIDPGTFTSGSIVLASQLSSNTLMANSNISLSIAAPAP